MNIIIYVVNLRWPFQLEERQYIVGAAAADAIEAAAAAVATGFTCQYVLRFSINNQHFIYM